MKVRKGRRAVFLPLVMTNLMLASWETIARRTLLIAQDSCSQSEYQRMVREKADAAMESSLKMISSGGRASLAALMAPWNRRATANARRLRKK